MVNVAVPWGPVGGANAIASPPPLVPSQLPGPKKNKAYAGSNKGVPPQPTMVIRTVPPTGAASGQTVIRPGGTPLLTADDEAAHPAGTGAGVA